MTSAPPPEYPPIQRLTTFWQFAAEWKPEKAEYTAHLRKGLSHPGELTDAHVARLKKDCEECEETLDMFEGAARHWATLRKNLSAQQRRRLDELADDLAAVRRMNDECRDLTELLARATLEQQLAAPDEEWGAAALLGKPLPPRF